jgi:hypothetical protein
MPGLESPPTCQSERGVVVSRLLKRAVQRASYDSPIFLGTFVCAAAAQRAPMSLHRDHPCIGMLNIAAYADQEIPRTCGFLTHCQRRYSRSVEAKPNGT